MGHENRTVRVQFDIDPHIGRKLGDVERDLILGTLARCGGNRTWASDILGISVRTLRNKLQRYEGGKVPVEKRGPGRMSRSEEDALAVQLREYNPGSRLPS